MEDLWQPVPLPEEPPPPRRPWRRCKAAAAWLVRLLAAATFIVIILFSFLTRTDRGATVMVEQVLRRLPIRGEITATGARSDGLVEGVQLYGVAIRGDDGRLLLLVDSVRLRYNWRTFVSGDMVFDTLELWRPRVMLTRYPGESEFNVQRLFISEEETRDTARASLNDLIFREVSIHGGEARVLYPAGPAPGARWVTLRAPGGDSLLVRHTFAGIDARLPSVVLQSPDSVGQYVVIDSLAFLAEVLDDPVQVLDLKGRLRWVETRLDLDLTHLALSGSEACGTVFVELGEKEEPVHYGFDIETSGTDLADLAWLDPRVTEGQATGGFAMDARGAKRHLTFRAVDVSARESRLRLDGGVALDGDRVRFEELDVRASPVSLARVQPWLERPLPVRGSVQGDAELDGTLEELAARGRVTLRRPDAGEGPITADFTGTLHLAEDEEGFGFTDLRATLDPFDFGVLGDFVAGVNVTGPGHVTVEATGRAGDAVRFTTRVQHRPTGVSASDVDAQGTVRRRGGEWMLDVEAHAQPLSLTALGQYYPDLPVSGNVSGTVHARGPLSDITLETDLKTDAGRLAVTARFDAANPGERYAVEGEVTQFTLSKLVTDLPGPTVISGYVDLEGRGTDPATLTLDARARLRPSRVGGLEMDTVVLAVRVREGLLHLDLLDAVLDGIDVQGQGTLAMQHGGPAGTVTIAFQSDSLARLRPLVLGDVVIARDTLTALDLDLLLAEGIDPDTLPTQADVELSGAIRGVVTLTGSIRDFAADGSATFDRVRYGVSVVRGATVTFKGSGLPSLEGRLAGTLEADSLTLGGRDFAGTRLDVDYTSPCGRAALALRRDEGDEYTARVSFQIQGSEGSLELEELALRFDSLIWALERPAVLAWNDQGLRIEDLVLSSVSFGDSLRIEADGIVPRRGPADLSIRVEALQLERVAGLFQREDIELTGRLDLTTRVTGTAAAPVISGSFDAADLDIGTLSLTRLVGQLDYADRTLRLDVGAWQDALRVLTATGQVPVDLAFGTVDRRASADREMDLSVTADSLPAALVLAYLSALTDVEGTVSGQFHITGTVDDPSPTGSLALNDAAWTLEDLGVRHRAILGTLTLRPDGVVDVAAGGRGGDGTISTTGTVALQPLTDPTLDLLIFAQAFQAVARPDIVATLTGGVTLTGTYSRPVVQSRPGQPVRMNDGVLYVEEFQRTVGIVDLADPAFFAVVDTSVVNPRPLLGATSNPFLRNMRVDVDLVAERNSWLRSADMNVEMGGELEVVYDRQSGDLVMIGDLQAIRGTYAILGRNFQVQSGAVEFVGTPGINPILNIVASTRVRQGGSGTGGAGGDNLTIHASVTGTLVQPRVTLSSPESAIAQSDLVSYLVFGVPSYQLSSGQAARIESAARTTGGAVLSIGFGTLTSQLSSLVAREWGLDYFAISQPDQLNLSSANLGLAGTLASTTFEVGWYLEQDVFLTLLIRPLAGGGADRFGGARVDWVVTDAWTLQAFFEDRFLRQPTLGFDQQILESQKVAGLFLFRDWGYGRPRPAVPIPEPKPSER